MAAAARRKILLAAHKINSQTKKRSNWLIPEESRGTKRRPSHTTTSQQIFYINPRYILFIHLVVNDMIQVTLTLILFIITTTSMSSALSDLFITLATQPLDFHSQVFCLRETVFPNPLIIKKRDITYSVFLVIVWITLFYIYFKILLTAKTASKDAKKARNTILLHGFQLLLCMATYAAPQLLNVLKQWFPENYTDSLFASYIIVQILPRSISPIIYGLRDNTFRKYLKRYLLCTPYCKQPFKNLT
ncbi:odorant receptor 131-2-like [Chaetodon trifascialis]|uniref:odorant receptor 131-2-like n=1 Tax=Chaetodon trifascialis TaxID=109706 RepID=UPI003992CF9F